MKEIVRPGLQGCRYPPKLLQQVVTLVVIGHVTQRIREGQTHHSALVQVSPKPQCADDHLSEECHAHRFIGLEHLNHNACHNRILQSVIRVNSEVDLDTLNCLRQQ